MGAQRSRRMRFDELPDSIRDAVQQILGSAVVDAVSQPGGFSSGTADRVRTAAGGTAFVKAMSQTMNAGAADLHRREAHITAALAAEVSVPQLLGSHDDGEWVVLVFEDVNGRHPTLPWREAELATVLAALRDLAVRLTPSPVLDVARAADVLAEPFAGWQRVAASPPADLDPWAARHLPLLCDAATDGLAALSGDTLVHYDIRADNLLLRADGRVMVVDWPWACRGPAWLDTLMLLAGVRQDGQIDVDELLQRGVTADVDPAVLTAVLIAQSGYFLDASRQPAPPGMEGLRPFQRAKADAMLPWIRHLLNA
jgi:aminoglycoside phosphotransferase (APT) family kinase protein